MKWLTREEFDTLSIIQVCYELLVATFLDLIVLIGNRLTRFRGPLNIRL